MLVLKKDQVLHVPRIDNWDANKFSRFATITFCICVLLTPHITIVYYWHRINIKQIVKNSKGILKCLFLTFLKSQHCNL